MEYKWYGVFGNASPDNEVDSFMRETILKLSSKEPNKGYIVESTAEERADFQRGVELAKGYTME